MNRGFPGPPFSISRENPCSDKTPEEHGLYDGSTDEESGAPVQAAGERLDLLWVHVSHGLITVIRNQIENTYEKNFP
jgi:hypothetical protein